MLPANLYCTLARLPELPLAPMSQRDRTDPALIEHLRGLSGWIMQHADGGPPTPAQAHAVEHTWRVHHHLVFDLEVADEAVVIECARAANALVFLPDGTLRNPNGEVVVGPNATGDVPYLARGLERATQSSERLAALGFQVPPHVPAIPSEEEVVVRTGAEVAARIRGLVALAVCGEARASGEAFPVEEIHARLPGAAFTPRDTQFLESGDVPREVLPEFTWKYESAHALQWAAGLVPELMDATQICDVPQVTRCGIDFREEDVMMRSATEILDALDVHYRQHWLVVEAQHGSGAEVPWQPGVLYERRVALSWLIRLGEFDWDEIPTPT